MNKSKDNPLPETKNDPRQVSFQLQSLQLQMSLPRFSNKTLKNFIIINIIISIFLLFSKANKGTENGIVIVRVVMIVCLFLNNPTLFDNNLTLILNNPALLSNNLPLLKKLGIY